MEALPYLAGPVPLGARELTLALTVCGCFVSIALPSVGCCLPRCLLTCSRQWAAHAFVLSLGPIALH